MWQVARLGYYPPFISLDDPLLDANAGIAMKFVDSNTRDRCSPKLNLNFQKPKRQKARGKSAAPSPASPSGPPCVGKRDKFKPVTAAGDSLPLGAPL